MTSDDERDLRQRLGSALETITPHQAPVDVVLRKGRARRVRRHIAAAAGLAVAVGIGVAVPSLIHQIARPEPASPAKKPTVTVNPIGPGSPRGMIGSGTINGKSWRLIAQQPGTQGAGKDQQCFLASGTGPGSAACVQLTLLTGDSSNPVSFTSVGGDSTQVQFGGVAPDVMYVNVTLTDGTVLVLHPANAYGQREVAFAIPQSLGIARVVAYSRQAELAYSVPFNSGSGALIGAWLRPGQRGLPRGTYKIGSGETVHVGPWGYCITGVGQECIDTQSQSLGNLVGGDVGGPGGAKWAFGTATAAVDHVRVHLSGGITLTARAVECGGPRFYAYVVPKGHKTLMVAYYSASGHLLASQSGSQLP